MFLNATNLVVQVQYHINVIYSLGGGNTHTDIPTSRKKTISRNQGVPAEGQCVPGLKRSRDWSLQQKVRKQELQIQILVKATRFNLYFGWRYKLTHQAKVGIKSCRIVFAALVCCSNQSLLLFKLLFLYVNFLMHNSQHKKPACYTDVQSAILTLLLLTIEHFNTMFNITCNGLRVTHWTLSHLYKEESQAL